jgi:hypothetical protein
MVSSVAGMTTPFPERQPDSEAQAILDRKAQLEVLWRMLPPEHQATMALVLCKEVLNGEYGGWFLDGLLILSAPPRGDVSKP